MTIAACYVSAEGVVLGADSTSTVYVPGPPGVEGNTHFFNLAQKVFEFGEDSSIGIVTWGLGSLGDTSHRTVIAEVADTCDADPGISLRSNRLPGGLPSISTESTPPGTGMFFVEGESYATRATEGPKRRMETTNASSLICE